MLKGLDFHITRAMEQHGEDPIVQQWGCRALRGLSLSGIKHKKLMVDCGVLELVFSCIQRSVMPTVVDVNGPCFLQFW